MVNRGPTMDMTTITDIPFSGSGQENGPYYFVKKPDLPLNVDPAEPQHPHFQQDAPDVASADDSLSDALKLLLKFLTNKKKSSRDLRFIKIAQIFL